MHRMQNRVRRDQHRQISRVDREIERAKAVSLIMVDRNEPVVAQYFLLDVRQFQLLDCLVVEIRFAGSNDSCLT